MSAVKLTHILPRQLQRTKPDSVLHTDTNTEKHARHFSLIIYFQRSFSLSAQPALIGFIDLLLPSRGERGVENLPATV